LFFFFSFIWSFLLFSFKFDTNYLFLGLYSFIFSLNFIFCFTCFLCRRCRKSFDSFNRICLLIYWCLLLLPSFTFFLRIYFILQFGVEYTVKGVLQLLYDCCYCPYVFCIFTLYCAFLIYPLLVFLLQFPM
jgi:hypothetical protein